MIDIKSKKLKLLIIFCYVQFKNLQVFVFKSFKIKIISNISYVHGTNSIKQLVKKFAEYQNHAHKDVMERDLSNYDAIVIVSGDGLIHEVKLLNFV